MKITCSKEEKKYIVDALAQSYHCFPRKEGQECSRMSSCSECVEQLVEWEIEGENE